MIDIAQEALNNVINAFGNVITGAGTIINFFRNLGELLINGINIMPDFLKIIAVNFIIIFIGCIIYKVARG